MSLEDENDTRPEDAKRLKLARMAAGFRHAKDAARRHGWTYETYHQHETGTRGFSRVASRYATAFRVSVGWLLHGEGRGPTAEAVEMRHGLTPDEIDEIEDQVDAIRNTLIERRLNRVP